MITINAAELSTAPVTSLQSGELFACSGSRGDFIAVVVENHDQRYMSWLRLTGNNRFLLDNFEGATAMAHSPRVLRLGLHWNDLRMQIDETCIKRIGNVPRVGRLIIGDQPCIVTRFGTAADGRDEDEDDAWGVSLRDLSRDRVIGGGYLCDRWQLLAVPHGLPPEAIAKFGTDSDQER